MSARDRSENEGEAAFEAASSPPTPATAVSRTASEPEPDEATGEVDAPGRYLRQMFTAEKGWPLAPALVWLQTTGRGERDAARFLAHLCALAVSAGAPLWRVRVDVRTIHPRFAVWGLDWDRDRGLAHEWAGEHGVLETIDYVGSPLQAVRDQAGPQRHRLDRVNDNAIHLSLQLLRARGATDYLALPLRFFSGQLNVLSIATDQAHGFSELDVRKLVALAEALALPVERFALWRMAKALLDTYVGPRIGGRILRGLVRRGDGEVIQAALWFSDLRDFTPLTEALPPEQVLALLNTYFEYVAAAATARGGEILRFIGDAMLIVFPSTTEGEHAAACKAALEAARDAVRGLATVNMRRARAGEAQISFGVGLHVGEVVYGNVGAPDRLDFTVMGPAVNRTARLESLTKKLGEPVLMSAAFAACVDDRVSSLGFQGMDGIAEPQEVFRLVDPA